MSFWKLWLALVTADWVVRVISGVFVAGGLVLSAETWAQLAVAPVAQALLLWIGLRVTRAFRKTREARA